MPRTPNMPGRPFTGCGVPWVGGLVTSLDCSMTTSLPMKSSGFVDGSCGARWSTYKGCCPCTTQPLGTSLTRYPGGWVPSHATSVIMLVRDWAAATPRPGPRGVTLQGQRHPRAAEHGGGPARPAGRPAACGAAFWLSRSRRRAVAFAVWLLTVPSERDGCPGRQQAGRTNQPGAGLPVTSDPR